MILNIRCSRETKTLKLSLTKLRLFALSIAHNICTDLYTSEKALLVPAFERHPTLSVLKGLIFPKRKKIKRFVYHPYRHE